jgi:pilus assembly protein Flp/PilA
MKNFFNTANKKILSFAKEDDGAQVVEYALIIAVVSIGLVLVLGDEATGISSKFAAFATRVGNCLSTGQVGC